jgi:hypothetical protein
MVPYPVSRNPRKEWMICRSSADVIQLELQFGISRIAYSSNAKLITLHSQTPLNPDVSPAYTATPVQLISYIPFARSSLCRTLHKPLSKMNSQPLIEGVGRDLS